MSPEQQAGAWESFRNVGMLWWLNRILHTFGWEIVVAQHDDGAFAGAFPQRTENLGFAPETDERRVAQFRSGLRGEVPAPQPAAKEARQQVYVWHEEVHNSDIAPETLQEARELLDEVLAGAMVLAERVRELEARP